MRLWQCDKCKLLDEPIRMHRKLNSDYCLCKKCFEELKKELRKK